MTDIKLKLLKDKNGIVNRLKDDVIEYTPWDHDWQGMSEKERVARGIFVHCYGHGEFEVLYSGKDVTEV